MDNKKSGYILRNAKAHLEGMKDYGLLHNPFVKTVPTEHIRREVFTDREQEMERLISAILTAPHNILVYGSYGVGKTIFILESLRELGTDKKFLPIYTTFEGSSPDDLERCALLALAKEMREWEDDAQIIYDVIMGATRSTTTEKELGIELNSSELLPVSIGGGGKSKKSYEFQQSSIQHTRHHFKTLLDKSKKRYERVIIAIDEVEKREPSSFEMLLSNCRGMLDLECSFILTGGLWATWPTRNPRSPASGAFIDEIKLSPFDKTTALEVIIAYLNSARSDKKHINTIFPFQKDAIDFIIDISEGVPRVFNSTCYQSIEYSRQQKAGAIEQSAVLNILRAMGQVQYGDLLKSEQHLVDVLIKHGGLLSDNNVTALRDLGILTILEIYPTLEDLVQKDILQRTEDSRNIFYKLSPSLKLPFGM